MTVVVDGGDQPVSLLWVDLDESKPRTMCDFSGKRRDHYGTCKVQCQLPSGRHMELNSERCPVTRSVLSDGQFADAECTVVIERYGGYIVKAASASPRTRSTSSGRRACTTYLDGAEKKKAPRPDLLVAPVAEMVDPIEVYETGEDPDWKFEHFDHDAEEVARHEINSDMLVEQPLPPHAHAFGAPELPSEDIVQAHIVTHLPMPDWRQPKRDIAAPPDATSIGAGCSLT